MDGVVQDHPRGDCFFLEGGPAGQERKGLISEVPCRQGGHTFRLHSIIYWTLPFYRRLNSGSVTPWDGRQMSAANVPKVKSSAANHSALEHEEMRIGIVPESLPVDIHEVSVAHQTNKLAPGCWMEPWNHPGATTKQCQSQSYMPEDPEDKGRIFRRLQRHMLVLPRRNDQPDLILIPLTEQLQRTHINYR